MVNTINRCPTDPKKLLNPLTGRCVIESNATIRKLIKEGWNVVITPNTDQSEPPPSAETKIFKICPSDPLRLINPETGRCVKHDNKTIKKLLKEGWTVAINRQRTLPVLLRTNKISNWKKLKTYLDKNKDSIVSIDEYLEDVPITEQEELKSGGIFRHIYDSDNLITFLEIASQTNPILKKNICIPHRNIIHLKFGRLNLEIPEYRITDKALVGYAHYRPLRSAVLFNVSRVYTYWNLVIYERINEIIKNCKNRYLIIPLVLAGGNMHEFFKIYKSDKVNHMNVLIFDTVNKTIERFDPHGVTRYAEIPPGRITPEPMIPDDAINRRVDKYLRDYFELHVKDYLYKDVSYTCPYLGPQLKADVRGGYCVTWSLMYTLLRLLNPDTPPGTINRMLIKGTSRELKLKLQRFAKYYAEVLKLSQNYPY